MNRTRDQAIGLHSVPLATFALAVSMPVAANSLLVDADVSRLYTVGVTQMITNQVLSKLGSNLRLQDTSIKGRSVMAQQHSILASTSLKGANPATSARFQESRNGVVAQAVEMDKAVADAEFSSQAARTTEGSFIAIEGKVIDRARAFIGTLESGYLQQTSSDVRRFYYPAKSNTAMVVIGAIVPAKEQNRLPIVFCTQLNNSVIAIGAVDQGTGQVEDVKWDGPTTGEVVPGVGVRNACSHVLSYYLQQYKTMLTELNQTSSPTK